MRLVYIWRPVQLGLRLLFSHSLFLPSVFLFPLPLRAVVPPRFLSSPGRRVEGQCAWPHHRGTWCHSLKQEGAFHDGAAPVTEAAGVYINRGQGRVPSQPVWKPEDGSRKLNFVCSCVLSFKSFESCFDHRHGP